MELFQKKRKLTQTQEIVGLSLSFNDWAVHKEKMNCMQQRLVSDPIVTTPLPPLTIRGLKRKIGCVDAATRIDSKKKIEKDYILGSEIGHGKFGSVRLCKSRANGEEFACKTLCKGDPTFHGEVEIMQHLSGHPGIIIPKAVYEDSESFHIIMELCAGGRLVDWMATVVGLHSEYYAANALKELMVIVKYCHEFGVVHRDIKPENILLTASGKMKLADFGLATRISNGRSLCGLAGSPAYIAPEVLLGQEYSEKVDIWSAGVILYSLLMGALPFHGESFEEFIEAIKNANLDFNSGMWESISAPARNLVRRMLMRDASSRISAEEVLRHPWILFHTRQTLNITPTKSEVRSHVSPINCSSRQKLEENDMFDLMVEPRWAALCAPIRLFHRDCSAVTKANNMCAAF